MRNPAAAGRFYPADSETLRKMIERCFSSQLGPGKENIADRLKAAVVPHAGYVYSGPCAAHVYSRLSPSTAVVLGTNHTGSGSGLDTSGEDWVTPLGEIKLDREMRDKLMEECDIKIEESAHALEHSIEVQLPFLQFKGFEKFVPISVSHLPRARLMELGEALREVSPPVILASSDFSHYVSQKTAERIDLQAIELIEKGDADSFLDFVEKNHASICGAAPIAALLYALQSKGKLLKYYTSGEVTGDRDQVVGYGAIGFR